MAVSVVRYERDGGPAWGRLVGAAPLAASDVLDVAPLAIDAPTTAALLAAMEGGPVAEGDAVRISASSLLSAVTPDGKILCQGLNYADHAAEAQHHERRQNLFFMKASSTLTGAYADVTRPAGVELLDYEVEIGVVLRSTVDRAITVTDANIGHYVAGVVLCNDVSARDTMFGASFLQWWQGKSYRGFCPAGPVLLLLDPPEVADVLASLEITLDWGGSRRQSARSAQLIYKPAETIAQLSEIIDLNPGDMILTGTPGGVIAQGSPKIIEILASNLLADEKRRDAMRAEMLSGATFLQPGDVVRLEMRDTRSGTSLGGQETHIV